MGDLKLNIGCGTDYRDGFVNIDGSRTLSRVDKVIDINNECLMDYFVKGSVAHVLANDIIEHHFHWQAVELLEQFYHLLAKRGVVEIRVPDSEWIIRADMPVERKLLDLYGGQDVSQGVDAEMDLSRKRHPEYFCHKYGWTRERMERDLKQIGYKKIRFLQSGTNFVTTARK